MAGGSIKENSTINLIYQITENAENISIKLVKIIKACHAMSSQQKAIWKELKNYISYKSLYFYKNILVAYTFLVEMLIKPVFIISLLLIYYVSNEIHDYSIYDGLKGSTLSIVEDCLYGTTSTVVFTSKVSDYKHRPIANYILRFLIKRIETCVLLFVGTGANDPWDFNVIIVDDVKAFL